LPFATGPRGLPVGVQLVGARYADRALLEAAEPLASCLGAA
jgi:Asp-tRNA(Asn)/Glu-tRNA(Gln) amidotransferase A subunit family amidase